MSHGPVNWHVHDTDGTVLITRIGRGWIAVPRAVWDAFAAAIKRGEYDTRASGAR